MQPEDVLKKFGVRGNAVALGSGLINKTWVIENNGERQFILQRINTNVFKHPEDIAYNIRLIADHLRCQATQSGQTPLLVPSLKSREGHDLVMTGDGYFRLFPFVKNSHTIDVVQTPQQAYEAAGQFGKFTKVLSAFDASQLKITLTHFHDLSLRYKQFEEAVQNGNQKRIEQSTDLIKFLQQQKNIVDEFEMIRSNPDFKIRVTHHDTKISNVLFDENDKAICVIDLDTIMPGYFISDVGDMMRTYFSSAGEEENDLSKIEIRKDFYDAIVEGYLNEIGEELTTTERKYFPFAGNFMTYMQSLRFLTDYLNNDVYYGSKCKM